MLRGENSHGFMIHLSLESFNSSPSQLHPLHPPKRPTELLARPTGTVLIPRVPRDGVFGAL